MRNNVKRVLAVIIMVLMIGMSCIQTFARTLIDTSKACSLEIEYADEGTPIPNAEFRIYKIADVSETSAMTLCGAFKKYPVSLDVKDSSEWLGIASTLKGYVQADNIAPTDSGKTDSQGKLKFPTTGKTFERGVYLILGEPVQLGDKYIYTSTPFCVCVPGLGEKEAWIYDVTARPKFTKQEVEIPETKTMRKVIKEWDDSGFESIRPTEVTVELLCDGKVYDTKTLNKDNDWRYTWNDLENDHDWNLVEKTVPGYTVSIEKSGVTFIVKNTYKIVPGPETTSRKVVKVWDDVGHEDKRPSEVSVSLLRNGEVFDTKALTKDNGWEYTWNGLDASYNWDVSEKEVKGYSSSVRTSGTTLIIVNRYNDVPPTPAEKVTRKAVKVWSDNGYENKRPSEVTVYLLRNGKVYDTKTLSARNGWEYTWTELDPKYTWEVKEKAVEGYSGEIKTYGETAMIVNTYEVPHDPTPETTSRKVVKIWNDVGHESERPTEVTVSLLRNGEVYDTKTLTKENGWEYTWNGLDASYNWDVAEKEVKGYSSSVRTSGTTLIIVNTFNEVPPTHVTRKAVKIWSDNGYESKRPAEVTVYLLRDGEVYDTKTLSAGNDWEYIWTELDPQYTWEVKEKAVEGYSGEIKKSGDTVVIVNTYEVPDEPTPETKSCSVTPAAVKRVVGDTPKVKGAFKFLLSAVNADSPMPAGTKGKTAEATIYGAGTIGFGTITFNEEGTYVYTVSEINTAEGGYTYDTNVYTVKYNVVKSGNELKSTCEITDIDGKSSSSVVFTNTYKTPGEKLPQTGVLWWPVPVLLCLGLIFLILGTVLKRRNNER